MGKKRSSNGFVVGSKVREFMRVNRCFAGCDLVEGINKHVTALLKAAAERARQNKRKTVRGYDL